MKCPYHWICVKCPYHFNFHFLMVVMRSSNGPLSYLMVPGIVSFMMQSTYEMHRMVLHHLIFMRELFAVVLQLMSKIHMHAERLRRPMHATVWSLISTKCSLLVEWIIRNSWLGPIPTIFLSHSALLVTRLYLDDL